MAPRGKSGKVSVDVVADVAGFGAQLARDLNKELRKIRLDTNTVSDGISDGIEKGVKEGEQALGKLPPKAKETVGKIGEEAEEAGKKLGDEVKDGADKAKESLDDVGDKAKETGRKLGEEIGKGSRKAGDEAANAADEIKDEMGNVDRQIDKVKRSIQELSREFARTGNEDIFVKIRGERATLANLHRIRAALDEVGDEAEETKRKLGGAVGGMSTMFVTLRNIGGKIGEVGVSLGSALVGLGASAPTPAGLVAILLTLTAIVAITPLIIGLGAALADLIGLVTVVPAGIAVFAAVIAPLVIALHGLGDAFAAVMEGDPDKIKEAMEGLSPAARGVVREFGKLLPQLRKVGDAVQNAFFKPLKGSFTQIVGTLLPPVSRGLQKVARELGQLAAHFVDTLASPRTAAFITKVFDTVARLADKAGPALDALIDIFLSFGETALPIVEQFAGWLLKGAERLGDLVNGAQKSGALKDFLNDAVATLKDLWELVKAVAGLLMTIFKDADDDGRGFLDTITEMVNKLNDFFKSAEGQEALAEMFEMMSPENLGAIISGLGMVFHYALTVHDVIMSIIDFVGNLVGWIGDFIGMVGDFFAAIGDWFVSAWDAIVNFFNGLIQWFTDLPGRIWELILEAGARLLAGFQAAWNAALEAVGIGIGLVLAAIFVLPGMIWNALQALPGLMASFFTYVWNLVKNITSTVWNAIVGFFQALPGRVMAALNALPGLVASIWNRTVSTAKSIAVSGFNAVVSWVSGVPGRISALAGRFTSAGAALIRALLNGLRKVGNWAGDVGSAIVSAIKSGLNRMIGSINSGIGRVDALLPGSLPRIPYLARGGMTMMPTFAALSETGKREVVLPVEDQRTMAALRDALGLGGGPQIVFGAGAIQVTFAGVVPTEDEAYRTGKAIGDGVADTLARSDVATQIRTI